MCKRLNYFRCANGLLSLYTRRRKVFAKMPGENNVVGVAGDWRRFPAHEGIFYVVLSVNSRETTCHTTSAVLTAVYLFA